MTKQEEIREGIKDILRRYGNWVDGYDGDMDELDTDEALEAILSFLHSQGVVVKVEGELPKNPYPERMFPMDVDEGGKIQREKLGDKLTTLVNGGFGRHVYNFCQEDMARAGFVAVEPLIKEE